MWREVSPQYKYINDTFAPEDISLRKIRSALHSDGLSGMNIDSYEGSILQFLIGLSGAKRIIEVGTLYGYSTLWMGRALPADGRLISLESREQHYLKASELLADTDVAAQIELRYGRANELLAGLAGPPFFDMIFIDANKSGYLDYLNWAEKNIKPGGLIVGDNTLLFGHIAGVPGNGPEVQAELVEKMREFNRHLADKKKYRSILLPTSEGMTVAQKLF